MRRGDVVTLGGSDGSASRDGSLKAVVIQSDIFPGTLSVTVCPLTEQAVDAPLLRQAVAVFHCEATSSPRWVMVDKLTVVPRSAVREVVGRLHREEQVALDRRLAVFLGLA